MRIDRRDFVVSAAAAALSTLTAPAWAVPRGTSAMYGLIGKMTAAPGQRDALIAILLDDGGVDAMPGCLSYVVATDPADADALWITEVWDSKASHDASLTLPSVRQAISRARPMIAGFGESHVTTPVGGYGLSHAG
jgi:quinol monooxygenase YgiN